MLERAKARSTREKVAPGTLDLIEADMVGLRLADGATFRLAVLALNSLMMLGTKHAQQAAIQALADHLEPGGLAVVDAWLPDAEDLARYDGRIILEWPRRDPETGHVVTKTGSAQYDSTTGTVTLTTIFEEGSQGGPPARWVRTERLRLVSADELAGFAEIAGLRVEMVAGGYDLEPLGPGGERAVLIAIRP
jgi:SAM-dependent methyltransferase